MSGPGGRGSVTGRDVALAALAAIAVLVLGLAGADRSRQLSLERRTTDDVEALGELAARVAVDLERGLLTAVEAARSATGAVPVLPSGFVPIDPATSTGAGEPALSPADRADRDVAAILDRTRDSGEALLSAPVELAGGPRTLTVAAAYTRDAVSGRPRTTVERRARISGWVVVPVDLGELLDSHLPDGLAATISDGRVSSSAAAPAPPGLPEQRIEVGTRQLTIRAGDPGSVGLIAPTILLVAATALLAAVAAATVLAVSGRVRGHRLEAVDRASQVRLIGEVAPLVQQSLELADVLPAVAVQLSDHFDLAGVALSTGTSSAGQVELFSIGEAPEPGAKAVLRPPEHLPAGDTLALALQRGGRSVALLRLVAGRDLDEAELQSLRALSELVTAAVVNAALYASQQETLRRLRELDALKTVFLGTASHELRTPATAIGGFASLLTANWDRFEDDQRRDFVGRIGANARSLSAVVQDLLDFSLLDKGTLAVTIEEIDLGALVGSVVDRLSPIFSDHQISFVAAPAPVIAGDVNGLERVVTNLLTNAVRFSPVGSAVTVAVGPAQDGYGAEVVVSDQGPGIPVEERQQVFTRFYRGQGEAVMQTRGVGIGLSVVAEFVARLRGDVTIDDAPGGARLTVRLPASSAHLLAKEVVHAPTT